MRHLPSFFAAGHFISADAQLFLPQKNIHLALYKVLSGVDAGIFENPKRQRRKRYAKRIQQSLLPTEKYIERVLKQNEEEKKPEGGT